MAGSNQEKQDQIQSFSMDDSTATTIEFLRARLLAERSVSKSARQRADELGKRVEELEEQLRIVSRQRKMAEKATMDLLSILEDRGISDASEGFDSGSDNGTHGESQGCNDYPNGEEHFVASKRRELEDLSSSDLDSCQFNSRSLSWKGCTDSQRSREKNKDPSMRRRNAFSLIGSSSSKHHLGKSCRQNRRRDTRMVVEDCKTEAIKFNSQENGVLLAQRVPDCSESTQNMVKEGLGSVENGRNATNPLDVNGHLQDKDMEKAVEDQAQLIGQYEEMEKAQREWEEKFRENNSSTPDPYDPGNHSDVTEEREEVKAQLPSNMGTDISETEEANEEKVHVSKESPKKQANGFVPPSHADNGDLMGPTRTSVNTLASTFQDQEFAFPKADKKEARESLQNHDFVPPPQSLIHSPLPHGPTGPLSETGSTSHKGDHFESQNDPNALVPHNPRNALGGVLNALKQAKLQLHYNMNRLPPEAAPTSAHKAVQPLPHASRIGGRAEVSVEYTGLFRLPTEYPVEEADTRANFLGSRSSFRLAPYYLDNGAAVSRPDQFPASPYIERRSEFPTDDRFLSRSYVVPGSRASSSSNLLFDPYIDTRLSSASGYNQQGPQRSYHPFPDAPVAPRIPADEGFRRTFPTTRKKLGAPEDQMLFYNDHGRPGKMFR